MYYLRFPQRNRTIAIYLDRDVGIDLWKETDCKELSPMTVDTEKFCDVLTASWTTRRSSGVVQSHSRGLGTKKAGGASPVLSLKSQEVGVPMHKGQKKMIAPSVSSVPCRPSTGGLMPILTGEGHLLHVVCRYRH